MSRYVTPIFKIDVPNLDETPDVPRDFKTLADRIEALFSTLPPALPDTVYSPGNNAVEVNVTGGSSTDAKSLIGPVVSIKNPHSAMDLLVDVRQKGWALITGGTDTSCTIYGEPLVKCAGGSMRFASQSRNSAENVLGAQKSQSIYDGMPSYQVWSIPPGGTLTMQVRVWSNRPNHSVHKPRARYLRAAIIPIGWNGTIHTGYTEDPLDADLGSGVVNP